MIEAVSGALLGSGVGWMISRYMGRVSGGVCPILCNPKVSIPYFAFIGLVVAMEIMK